MASTTPWNPAPGKPMGSAFPLAAYSAFRCQAVLCLMVRPLAHTEPQIPDGIVSPVSQSRDPKCKRLRVMVTFSKPESAEQELLRRTKKWQGFPSPPQDVWSWNILNQLSLPGNYVKRLKGLPVTCQTVPHVQVLSPGSVHLGRLKVNPHALPDRDFYILRLGSNTCFFFPLFRF